MKYQNKTIANLCVTRPQIWNGQATGQAKKKTHESVGQKVLPAIFRDAGGKAPFFW